MLEPQPAVTSNHETVNSLADTVARQYCHYISLLLSDSGDCTEFQPGTSRPDGDWRGGVGPQVSGLQHPGRLSVDQGRLWAGQQPGAPRVPAVPDDGGRRGGLRPQDLPRPAQ